MAITSESDHASELNEALLNLARTLGSSLRRQHLTLGVAESATSGLIGHLLTEIPGSSDYFVGGVIAYSNTVKTDVLRVPQKVLERYGAVSEETVVAMVHGIRRLLGADVGVASTGIAGPTGATPLKPVGLIYVAVEFPPSKPVIRRYEFKGSRSSLKVQFAKAALELLLECLQRQGAATQPS